MSAKLQELFQGEPQEWIAALPDFQRDPIESLIQGGATFESASEAWISASAENTFRFSSVPPAALKGSFFKSLRKEIRAYLCGDDKYEKERAGLFAETAPTRSLVVGSIAVAIAPHLSVASAVIAPLIALTLASVGKITLYAWCDATKSWSEIEDSAKSDESQHEASSKEEGF